MTKKHDPVLISLVRNTLPDLIADVLLGVQPMTSPYNREEWPYQIDILEIGSKFTMVMEMRNWCKETIEEGEWTNNAQYFAFKTEEALSWFKLRWL